ncbi:MAG: hypothetical protein IT290_04955 [Deltaproteobacteria bacterium]|nr:hypothetical protein [Deltaproteobacteria bacterium]
MEATVHLGTCPFHEGRRVQQELIAERLSGRREDGFLLCEHFPVVTLGRQTSPVDINQDSPFWASSGIAIERADRGGGPTYHAPGQLVVYPVI